MALPVNIAPVANAAPIVPVALSDILTPNVHSAIYKSARFPRLDVTPGTFPVNGLSSAHSYFVADSISNDNTNNIDMDLSSLYSIKHTIPLHATPNANLSIGDITTVLVPFGANGIC